MRGEDNGIHGRKTESPVCPCQSACGHDHGRRHRTGQGLHPGQKIVSVQGPHPQGFRRHRGATEVHQIVAGLRRGPPSLEEGDELLLREHLDDPRRKDIPGQGHRLQSGHRYPGRELRSHPGRGSGTFHRQRKDMACGGTTRGRTPGRGGPYRRQRPGLGGFRHPGAVRGRHGGRKTAPHQEFRQVSGRCGGGEEGQGLSG